LLARKEQAAIANKNQCEDANATCPVDDNMATSTGGANETTDTLYLSHQFEFDPNKTNWKAVISRPEPLRGDASASSCIHRNMQSYRTSRSLHRESHGGNDRRRGSRARRVHRIHLGLTRGWGKALQKQQCERALLAN
jgi:hypothetical protein